MLHHRDTAVQLRPKSPSIPCHHHDVDRDLEWSSTVVLGDGSSALHRPIRPADADALAAFHLRQAPA
ncbi:MAG: hypothetical protein RLZZ01_2462, partial [Actinomycetota bacterium]